MYCDRCGTNLAPGARFCFSCGNAVSNAPGAAQGSRVARHLRPLGILWVVLSSLHLLGAFFCWLAGQMILRHLPGIPLFVPAVVTGAAYLLLLAGVIGLAAGWGLLSREPWARVLTIVLGCLLLLKPPFGTALGIYTLWVLIPKRSEEEYRTLVASA